MGNGRFLYQNLITDETMISVSSLRTGIVTAALKEGAGSAVMTPAGSFTGTTDLEYTIEIDSVAGGTEVGQATFRWTDGQGSWNASGVTTSAIAILLNNGVTVQWASGSGADFASGDKWYLKGVNLFNAGRMIDQDRDHRYRSQTLESPNTITIDLGSAQVFSAIVIYDHNLTSGATITFEADAAATFDSDGGNPQVSESVTWASEKIVHYLAAAATKRYARLKITDSANSDAYIEIGELYLGQYIELTRNYVEGFKIDREFLADANTSKYGVVRERFYNQQKTFSYDYDYIESADVDTMETMIDALCSRSTGQFFRFYFNEDSAVPGNTWLVKLLTAPTDHKTRGYYGMPLTFREVAKSV